MNDEVKKNESANPIGLLLLISIIWGSSFILIKKALVSFTPFQLITIRLGLSGLIFLPFVIYKWRQIPWAKWKYFVMIGYVGTLIPFTFYSIGQTKVSSSTAGIINSLTPILTLVMGVLFFNQTINARKVIGVMLGLSGTIFLVWSATHQLGMANLFYPLLIVSATLFYAFNVNMIAKHLQGVNPVLSTAVAFVSTLPPCVIFWLMPGAVINLAGNPQVMLSFFYVSILAILGTVVATALYLQLIQRTSPVYATMVSYLIPISSVLWGTLDGEKLHLGHFIGMGLILGGVYLVQRKSSS